MNHHDIISDSDFEKMLEAHKREERIHQAIIGIVAVITFLALCSPVLFQSFFGMF